MASFTPAPVTVATRSKKKMIVPRGASLPAQCIKCGRPAERPWKKKFYWHQPWLYLLVLFPGLLIYAIVALIIRKSMELNVPLCEAHHGDRKRYIILASVMLIGCIPVPILLSELFNMNGGAAFLIGVGMFLVGVIFYSRASFLRPTKIDDSGAEFTGAGESFLQLLPQAGF